MRNILLIIFLFFVSISFGILKVGVAITEPYVYFEEVNEGYLLKGIDINLMKMISKDLNEKLEIYIYSFPDLIENGLKEMDMIIGGIHITNERKKHIKFTIPYLTTGLVILELKDNEKNEIKSFAVKKNSTGYKTVLKWKKEGKNVDYIIYETNEECLNALLSKKVEGAFFDLINGVYLMKKYPVKIYKEPLTKNDVGIGIKTKELLEKINPLILKYRRDNLIGD